MLSLIGFFDLVTPIVAFIRPNNEFSVVPDLELKFNDEFEVDSRLPNGTSSEPSSAPENFFAGFLVLLPLPPIRNQSKLEQEHETNDP